MSEVNETSQSEASVAPATNQNKRTALKFAMLTLLMFGFAFAMVPLYKLVCQVAGINSIDSNTGRSQISELSQSEIDKSTRTITVQFDSTINGNMAWEFKPEVKTMQVKLGERINTSYFFKNKQHKDCRNAVYSRCHSMAGKPTSKEDGVLLL